MDKLLDILKSAGFPYAYDHFAEGEAPDPPLSVTYCRGAITFQRTGRSITGSARCGWNCTRILKPLLRSRK